MPLLPLCRAGLQAAEGLLVPLVATPTFALVPCAAGALPGRGRALRKRDIALLSGIAASYAV
jgi:hypothetical protein